MFDATAVIQRELMPGEQLLWSGTPRTGIVFRTSDLFLIPFSVLWCGFAVFWLFTATRSGAPLPFVVFGVPFVAVGLYFVFGRFLLDAKQRGNTYYGLTSRRVIILSGVLRREVESLELTGLNDVTLSESRDGGGVITFGRVAGPWGAMRGWSWPGMEQYLPPCFELDGHVRWVYEQILGARAAATTAANVGLTR